MRSSGTTGLDTSDNAPITLIDSGTGRDRFVNVVNTGTAPGFVSVDGGITWFYMPAGQADAPASRTFDFSSGGINAKVMAKRITDGSDMTGLYADAY